MKRDLIAAIGEIKQVAPGALIYVAAYVKVFPDSPLPYPPENPMTAADTATLVAMGRIRNVP